MPAPRDDGPIWSRPEPGARRPRFSREQISAAALAIADSEGFDAVSMRRVAAELGAGTMTLYHYVRTKDELVALMDDALMAAALIPDGELPAEWRPAVTMVAHRTRAAISQHPWALVSLRDANTGPNAMRHFEQSLQALDMVDADYATKIELWAIVDDYVHGHLLRNDEMHARTDETTGARADAALTFVKAQVETGELPRTKELFEETERGGGWQLVWGEDAVVRRFDVGLQALLDGLTRRFSLPTE